MDCMWGITVVQLNGSMSVVWVPQGSILGPMKLCLYLLPLSAILRQHNIGYPIHADGTQLGICFNLRIFWNL